MPEHHGRISVRIPMLLAQYLRAEDCSDQIQRLLVRSHV